MTHNNTYDTSDFDLDNRMDHDIIRARLDHLLWFGDYQPAFAIRYKTFIGSSLRYGGQLSEPVKGEVIFNEWDLTTRDITNLGTTGLIRVSNILELWTEDDDCPSCGQPGANPESLAHWDQPICMACSDESHAFEDCGL